MKELSKILVNQNATIKEAMKVIDQGAIRTAVVVDESNKLLGIATDGDIRRGIIRGIGIDEKISRVMNKNPVYASINSSKGEILQLLKSKKILCLPLIDENKIIKDFVLLSEGTNLFHFSERPQLKRRLHRILVIGGAGYIGSVLVRKLLSRGYKVNVLDKFIYGRESLEEIESSPNLNIIEGDTRHIEDITEAIKNVDAVVHLAELVGDPACALNPSVTQETNYLATKTIAEICKHFQINRLVYASSCSVYGASKGDNLLTEDSPFHPISLYAKMKIASEKGLMEMKDDNFLPTILRLGTVFGFSYRPRFDLVINLLTAKAVREGKITIFGGDQWRPNVHVDDVADTIITILESPIEVVGGQIFNVGSEKNNHTINEIGELIKKIIPSAELIIEDKLIDMRDYKVDFSKLRKTLTIKMKRWVVDGINEIKEALEKHKDIEYKDKKYNNVKFLENNI